MPVIAFIRVIVDFIVFIADFIGLTSSHKTAVAEAYFGTRKTTAGTFSWRPAYPMADSEGQGLRFPETLWPLRSPLSMVGLLSVVGSAQGELKGQRPGIIVLCTLRGGLRG